MKTNYMKINALRKLYDGVAQVIKVILSGLPQKELIYRPWNKKKLHLSGKIFRPGDEKYYHRPVARPAAEKQSLLKERKKVRGILLSKQRVTGTAGA